MLKQKIAHSIKILKFAEEFANAQNYKLILAYSGGKDSDVLLDLAKLAGIKFEAVFNNTTVENSVTCRYIRSKNDNITWKNPRKNFYQICKHKKALPSIFRRFCCKGLKERKVKKSVTLFGIRKDESANRAKFWNEFSDKKKKQLPFADFQKLLEEKCKSKSVYFNPIFQWSDDDIWNYIRENNLTINPIYKTQSRCGCWLCPFASASQKLEVVRANPSVLKPLIELIDHLIAERAPIAAYLPDFYDILEWYFTQTPIKEFAESRKNPMFEIKSELQQIIEDNNLRSKAL